MECCDNKNIGCKNYENVCINCGTIFDYQYVNEIYFKDYNLPGIKLVRIGRSQRHCDKRFTSIIGIFVVIL